MGRQKLAKMVNIKVIWRTTSMDEDKTVPKRSSFGLILLLAWAFNVNCYK